VFVAGLFYLYIGSLLAQYWVSFGTISGLLSVIISINYLFNVGDSEPQREQESKRAGQRESEERQRQRQRQRERQSSISKKNKKIPARSCSFLRIILAGLGSHFQKILLVLVVHV
jgi:hypothetical protein